MNNATKVLSAVILALLAACGGGGTDQEEPTQSTPNVQCAASAVQCK